MDIIGSVVPQAIVPQTSHAHEAKGSKVDVLKVVSSESSSDSKIQENTVTNVKDTEAVRLNRVRSGAQLMKQVLGTGETFAIYRGGNGELVTRFTNREDGTFRYFPEQAIVQFREIVTQEKDAIIDTQA